MNLGMASQPNSRSPRPRQKASAERSADDFRSLYYRVLLYANRGALRKDFQEQVSSWLLEFSQCDAVELWMKDHAKYFRCEARRQSDGSIAFEITPYRSIPSPFSRRMRKGGFWIGSPVAVSHSASEKRPHASRPRANIAGDYSSWGLIPLRIQRRILGLLLLKSLRKDFFGKNDLQRYEGLARGLALALAHRQSQIDLRERVKELTCLYGIAVLAGQPGISLPEILRGIVSLLPPAWLYPQIASGRIVLDGRSYTTDNFKQGPSRLCSKIVVNGLGRGTIEVTYHEERPELDEGPFLKEERRLLDTVAREVASIIQRKEAEEAQEKLQEQLRHADRLATIGQLAAGVAHELNEPLGNILGFAQLAKKCAGLPKQAEEDLDKILNASLNAREVIRKMLSFARPIPPQKQKVSLNQIIEEGLHFFESRCTKEGVELRRLLDPELPEIVADPVQLNQVIVNLVINALQAMPQGGRLTIQTRSEEDHLCLIIEDTGTGMSEDVLRQIFTPFFTTKGAGLGTGLGLPVVHHIVTSHGGTISVDTQVGSGTRFEVRLPIESPSSPGDEP